MNYAQYSQKKCPIGSSVTEAACKTLVKQRLSCSGIRWKKRDRNYFESASFGIDQSKDAANFGQYLVSMDSL